MTRQKPSHRAALHRNIGIPHQPKVYTDEQVCRERRQRERKVRRRAWAVMGACFLAALMAYSVQAWPMAVIASAFGLIAWGVATAKGRGE